MDSLSKIKKSLREVVGVKPNLPLSGTVESVSDEVCSVKLKSGLVLTDVKLKATINKSNDYLLLKPKVGSSVVMLSLSGELENLTVIKIDKVETIEYNQNGLNVLIDSTDGKVRIKNNSVSLIDLLTELTETLKTLKVYTPAGPSGTPLPPTIVKLEQFKTGIKQLLK